MNPDPEQMSLTTWEKIIYNTRNHPVDLKDLKVKLSDNFYKEYERIKSKYNSMGYFDDNKPFVNDFIGNIPEKFEKLQLLIRPYKDKFYSCIITDEEVDILAGYEHYRWVNEMYNDGWHFGETKDTEARTHPDLTHFPDLDEKKQRFYRELIYAIPVILNRCSYEVFKPAEQGFIKYELTENIARAIHERYRILMREMDEKSRTNSVYEKLSIVNVYNRQYSSIEYDQLPVDIKSSNIDSAYHIATKMLSIGYTIREADIHKAQALLFLSGRDIETMAKLEHERWAWEKRLKGFTYGEIRNDALKTHHCLVPYNELPELEKEKDRVLVKFYPDLLHDINYSVVALSPEQMQNISYIPQQRILLQESLENIEKTIISINDKGFDAGQGKDNIMKTQLTETLGNIRSTIKEQYAASQVQQCILPTRLFFRSCLPDSFILFKPKDILSGDFYFISKGHNFVILAAVDCTGHGTAGAMLSMICSNFLDQAVNGNNLTDPSVIIRFIYEKLVGFMKRHNNSIVSNHGMEIAICKLIPETRTVIFAGINRPLYLFGNNGLEILEPQKVKAGEGYNSLLSCLKESQQVNVQKGDTLYLFSDGYVDQFGGIENTKFLTRNFKKLLESIQPKSMLEQFEILNSTIEKWKRAGPGNSEEQTDDILVIGVRL